MIKIRKAETADIDFITNAILEIETSKNGNTYSNLFGSSKEETLAYIKSFLEDDENKHNELSLDSFIIAEENGRKAGCCALIYTGTDYYTSKSELFPIHLTAAHLQNLATIAGELPDHREDSANKFFVEYIFVDEEFRGKGIAGKMIEYQIERIGDNSVYINVFEDNTAAITSYRKAGFTEMHRTKIDTPENKIYPAEHKIIMGKK